MIRRCTDEDFTAIGAIVNEAAHAYKGAIPDDCWRDPYMPPSKLRSEIGAGVEFWGWEQSGALVGVMGCQRVRDVTLIRHAYVRPATQSHGIGGALLEFLVGRTVGPLLVGTWAAAVRAIRLYERHGFRLASPEETARLLAAYWTIPARQHEVSVVLAYAGGGPRR